VHDVTFNCCVSFYCFVNVAHIDVFYPFVVLLYHLCTFVVLLYHLCTFVVLILFGVLNLI
jgi:hypothetical protein